MTTFKQSITRQLSNLALFIIPTLFALVATGCVLFLVATHGIQSNTVAIGEFLAIVVGFYSAIGFLGTLHAAINDIA